MERYEHAIVQELEFDVPVSRAEDPDFKLLVHMMGRATGLVAPGEPDDAGGLCEGIRSGGQEILLLLCLPSLIRDVAVLQRGQGFPFSFLESHLVYCMTKSIPTSSLVC